MVCDEFAARIRAVRIGHIFLDVACEVGDPEHRLSSHEGAHARARQQSRLTWRTDMTAASVNDYLRAGFQ